MFQIIQGYQCRWDYIYSTYCQECAIKIYHITSCHPWISRDICLHPVGGFRSPSSASRMKMAPAQTPDVIRTLVSYFCSLPGVPRKARKHWHSRAGFALSHNLPKQCDATLCWCRQVRRQRTRWHVYLQLQMCWERAIGTTVRYWLSHRGTDKIPTVGVTSSHTTPSYYQAMQITYKRSALASN